MAYTPKDWETGEVITEEALDHIEQGIANAGNIALINATLDTDNDDRIQLGKTYNEIVAMIDSGKVPVAAYTNPYTHGRNVIYFASCSPATTGEISDPYNVSFVQIKGSSAYDFSAETADETLVMQI